MKKQPNYNYFKYSNAGKAQLHEMLIMMFLLVFSATFLMLVVYSNISTVADNGSATEIDNDNVLVAGISTQSPTVSIATHRLSCGDGDLDIGGGGPGAILEECDFDTTLGEYVYVAPINTLTTLCSDLTLVCSIDPTNDCTDLVGNPCAGTCDTILLNMVC